MDPMQWLREQIAERQRAIELSGPARLGWATYRHEDGGMAYTSPVAEVGDGSGWVTAGKETEPTSVSVVFDPTAELAVCESHTAILDHVGKHGRSVLELDGPADEDFVGRLLVSLRAQELVRHVGIAYRHQPGYDEFVAALTKPKVTMQLSEAAQADELAARRDRDERKP